MLTSTEYSILASFAEAAIVDPSHIDLLSMIALDIGPSDDLKRCIGLVKSVICGVRTEDQILKEAEKFIKSRDEAERLVGIVLKSDIHCLRSVRKQRGA